MAFMMELSTICRPETHTHTQLYPRATAEAALALAARGELTGDARDQPQGPQDSEGSERFDIQTPRFPRHVVSRRLLAGFVSHRLQDDAEQAAKPQNTARGGRKV